MNFGAWVAGGFTLSSRPDRPLVIPAQAGIHFVLIANPKI
jgi:hypothetical protein